MDLSASLVDIVNRLKSKLIKVHIRRNYNLIKIFDNTYQDPLKISIHIF